MCHTRNICHGYSLKLKNHAFIPGSDICPVQCFENYLGKLNKKRPDLWQKEKKHITGFEEEWYINQVVGRDTLNDTMKVLSYNAGLSKIYTNHCIRATVVDVMQEHEFKNREIMFTTGHKNESSLNSYSTKLAPKKKREISQCLSKQLGEEAQPAAKIPKVTISKAPDDQQNLPPRNEEEPVIEVQLDPPQNENLQLNIPLENAEVLPPEQWDSDENLVKALEEIEKQNAHLFNHQEQAPSAPTPGNILVPVNHNVQNVQNVQQVSNKNAVPLMYFPGSNVTINYHFNK